MDGIEFENPDFFLGKWCGRVLLKLKIFMFNAIVQAVIL